MSGERTRVTVAKSGRGKRSKISLCCSWWKAEEDMVFIARGLRPLHTAHGIAPRVRPWLLAMLLLQMLLGAAGFASVSPLGICALRRATTALRPPPVPLILRRSGPIPAQQPACGRAAVRGARRVARRDVAAMASVYSAELTFKPLDIQQEFYVAKTLGSIALPGSVFACATESDGEVELSHFKFDLEFAGSVVDARRFVDEQFTGSLDQGRTQSGAALAPPEAIVVNPALLTYCAQMTFEALSDEQEISVASSLQSFVLPNLTFVSFDEAPKADGRSASFQFQFELGGTLDDARDLVDSKFPQATDRS